MPAHKGERHHKAKLTETQVREIRARYAQGGITIEQLAWEYGMESTSPIGAILHRRAWRHVA